jgi:proteasome accessory factor B
VARRLAPPPSTQRAVVLARAGAGVPLRREADEVTRAVVGPDDRTEWDRLVLTRSSVGLADEILGYGSDVYVEEPASLREAVVTRLSAVSVATP